MGSILCFHLGMGIVGMWISFVTSLGLVAITLLTVWNRRSQALPQAVVHAEAAHG